LRFSFLINTTPNGKRTVNGKETRVETHTAEAWPGHTGHNWAWEPSWSGASSRSGESGTSAKRKQRAETWVSHEKLYGFVMLRSTSPTRGLGSYPNPTFVQTIPSRLSKTTRFWPYGNTPYTEPVPQLHSHLSVSFLFRLYNRHDRGWLPAGDTSAQAVGQPTHIRGAACTRGQVALRENIPNGARPQSISEGRSSCLSHIPRVCCSNSRIRPSNSVACICVILHAVSTLYVPHTV
jgi:hypothetical protein